MIRLEISRMDAHPGDQQGLELRAELPEGATLHDLLSGVLAPYLARAPRAAWLCRARASTGWTDLGVVTTDGPPEQLGARLLAEDAPVRALLGAAADSLAVACRPLSPPEHGRYDGLRPPLRR